MTSMRLPSFGYFIALLFAGSIAWGCNIIDDGVGQVGECQSDQECEDQVCVEGECVECGADSDCPGLGACEQNSCISPCESVDCGEGGACVEEEDGPRCECSEGFVLVDGVCSDCDCHIANGVGACDEEGACLIAECDEGFYSEDDDPLTGCECGPDDWPNPETFADENCDGVDGNASIAVFVSPYGDDEHDGIRTRPVRTINRGIELAAEKEGRREVYIAGGVYEEIILLQDGISLYGGYFDVGLGEWQRGEDQETIISGVGLPGGHRPVRVKGVEDEMTLQLLTIRAADAPTPPAAIPSNEDFPAGASSVALTLGDNPAQIHLSHLTLEAGDGRVGVDGPIGDIGEAGEDGGHGYGAFDENHGRLPGQPVSQTCSAAEQTTNLGGRGGMGGNPADGEPAEEGEDGTGISGGPGGQGGTPEVHSICGSPQPGTDADDGGDGTASGQAGEPGVPAPQQAGLSSQEGYYGPTYLGLSAMVAEPGMAGSGGGGGGGGSGVRVELCVWGCSCMELPGSGGGAGGNGGCGGQPGSAGGWGGASIAILAVNSQLTIEHSTLRTGAGGQGGAGGAGGPGGQGGMGGLGAGNDDIEDSGDGGEGAQGGQGGGGAGGLGGFSLGILHLDVELNSQELTFDIGPAGQGGAGGEEDNQGQDGLAQDILQAVEIVLP